MKRTIKMTIISAFIIIFIFTISILNVNERKDIDEIIKIGNYGYIPNKDKYIELVNKKWKELGHDSKLEFIDWESYDELPSKDLELYIYDGLVYKSLRKNNLLEKIDNIDTSKYFKWSNNLLEKDNEVYAVPFLLCSDFLIYNKDNIDLSNIKDLDEINTTFTTQYYSMVLNYYIEILLSKNNNKVASIEQGKYDEEILNELYEIASMMNIEDYKTSNSSNYTGIENMNNGKYNSIYGFSEYINKLYNINNIGIKNISLEETNNKYFYVDYISMKKGISKEKEKLYTELIVVMTDKEVTYNYSKNNNNYLYLMISNKEAFKKLSKENNIYNSLYKFANNNSNRVFLYESDYYKEFNNIKNDLKNLTNKYLNIE